MIPRRRLSELIVSTKVNAVSHLVVEGFTDLLILRAFFDGEADMRSPHIYPITAIEIDCCPVSGLDGNRGRVIGVSAHFAQQRIDRALCIVDRDRDPAIGFYLNSHCMITGFSCLEWYAFEAASMLDYLNRFFLVDANESDLASITAVAQRMSIVHAIRASILRDVKLARVEDSLRVDGRKLFLDAHGWINRSRSRGGASEDWNLIASTVDSRFGELDPDYRNETSIHDMEAAFAFWMKAVKDIALDRLWISHHIRATASHEILQPHVFFAELKGRSAAISR